MNRERAEKLEETCRARDGERKKQKKNEPTTTNLGRDFMASSANITNNCVACWKSRFWHTNFREQIDGFRFFFCVATFFSAAFALILPCLLDAACSDYSPALVAKCVVSMHFLATQLLGSGKPNQHNNGGIVGLCIVIRTIVWFWVSGRFGLLSFKYLSLKWFWKKICLEWIVQLWAPGVQLSERRRSVAVKI